MKGSNYNLLKSRNFTGCCRLELICRRSHVGVLVKFMGVPWGKAGLMKVLTGVLIDCCWPIGRLLLLRCWRVSQEIKCYRATHLPLASGGQLKEEEKSTPGKPFFLLCLQCFSSPLHRQDLTLHQLSK